MNRQLLALCVLLTSFVHSKARAQDDDVRVKRFKQVIHAYLGRSKAKTELPRIVEETAKSLKLDEQTTQKLADRIEPTIATFVSNTAKRWSADVDLANLEGKSLTASTMLIEESQVWKKMLRETLDRNQLEAWTDDSGRRNKVAKEELATQIEIAEKRKVEQENRLEQRAIQRAAAMAAGGDIRGKKETLVRACRGLAKQWKGRAQTSMLDEVEWMKTSLELSPKQVRRLEVAVKGVLKKRFDQTLARVTVIEAKTPDDDDEETQQVSELQEIYSSLSANGTHLKNDRWAKSVKSTLSDKQFEQYNEEILARNSFRRTTQIRMIILTLDQAGRLSVRQREQLMARLSRYDGMLDVSSISTASTLYQAMEVGLRSIVDDVLSEAQIEKVKVANRVFRRLDR